MTIYIVYYSPLVNFTDRSFMDAFTTRERAEEYINKHPNSFRAEIEEYDLDSSPYISI